MKVAQLSPLAESVPPRGYGGTERIISYLTQELVKQGHEVTLFASGDSCTDASLIATCRQSLRSDGRTLVPEAYLFQSLERAFRIASRFDIIHSHVDFWAMPWAERTQTPVLTTLHGRLDIPEVKAAYMLYPDLPLVSVSAAQQKPIPRANWMASVHHGLPKDLYRFDPKGGDYLAFLGRLSPEKRPDHAIAIAKRSRMPLKIAAKVDPADVEYFRTNIEPLLDHPLIEFVGEISDYEKQDFLGNARALLAPFDWPEPFGLVFIEALACGTPVLAYRRGSVPEILRHGRTGYVGEEPADLVEFTRHLATLSRHACRESFEQHFTAARMAQDYIRLYEQMAGLTTPAATAYAAAR